MPLHVLGMIPICVGVVRWVVLLYVGGCKWVLGVDLVCPFQPITSI